MKYIIFLGDGMADEPKDGKTPLMVANKPYIDMLARKGRCGKLITVPENMPAGSEVANMSVLGYDPNLCYEGRGVLEAASMGVDINSFETAMRCNLICIENDRIKNHSAGHISSEEAKELIEFLDFELGSEIIKFHPGVSYRHLLVIKAEILCEMIPPHDVPGTLVEEVMPKDELVNSLIKKSWELLKNHPVNKKRVECGKDPANSIWPWSQGKKPKMETFQSQFGINGAVISAVDLIQGLGKYAGMVSIPVEGATGLYDTNYEGKADACIEALKKYDFVYCHVEASDEAGHEGDYNLKVKTIEYLDERLIKRVMEKLKETDYEVRIAILPDHPTPAKLKTHTREPVPFIIYDGKYADDIEVYDEVSTLNGVYGILKGDEFIKEFLN